MILPWLILIPFIGGLLCWMGERFGATLPRWIALLTMSLELALGLWLWAIAILIFFPIFWMVLTRSSTNWAGTIPINTSMIRPMPFWPSLEPRSVAFPAH